MRSQRSIPREDIKNKPLRFAFSKIHRTWSFHVVVLQRTAKIQNARAQLLFIPLTNRVRGSYRKLRSSFFPPRFMAQARGARAINRRGKNEDT